MSREAYLLNQEEDTIHDNQIVLETAKDKRKNWWHYNKIIILIIAIVATVIGITVYNAVTAIKPDYTIGFLTRFPMPADILEDLGDYLSDFGEDLNGDGRTVVQINTYNFSALDEDLLDPTAVEAAIVKFTADISSGDSMIFIHDEFSFAYINTMDTSGLWRYNDGSIMPDSARDYDNVWIEWDDILGLAEYEPQNLQSSILDIEDIKFLLSDYRISRRTIAGSSVENRKGMHDYVEACDELYENLIMDVRTGGSSEK